MRPKRLVPIVLLVLAATLAMPVQAASHDAEPESFSRVGKLVSTLADFFGLDRLFAASEKGPGMDPHGEPNDSTATDDPQSTTTSAADEGEKGPGMDPIG